MKKKYKIAILPGDGIGPEVMKEALKIIEVINKRFKTNIITKKYDIGGVAIDKHGVPLPNETISGCTKSNAILLGSVGGEKWKKLPINLQPETGALLKIRKHFNLFINLRPSKLHRKLYKLSPLKKNISSKGFDILCVRELIGGIYFGSPKGTKKNKESKYSFDTEIYSEKEITRISHIAFKLAMKRNRKLVSVDKANVLESSILWRQTVDKISKIYPKVKVSHLYIDNAVMQIINKPYDFDVILCSNLFGDIISDECAAISGSIGILPSASLNENNFGIFEPAGGSAPDIANKNIANPIAQILSLSMLLEHSFNLKNISKIINNSVNKVLLKGYRTFDISDGKKYITTKKMGDIIANLILKGNYENI
ncbi:3-isopropylmalate dehydrogenase [Buchnera aphidicola (Taiwanaphis decaspermi)]|uniref:3-isopropylmalate dehydrogenase n=1 Tax=Buchnera aphidicola TaxID=9 RepID=UPI0031B809F2